MIPGNKTKAQKIKTAKPPIQCLTEIQPFTSGFFKQQQEPVSLITVQMSREEIGIQSSAETGAGW